MPGHPAPWRPRQGRELGHGMMRIDEVLHDTTTYYTNTNFQNFSRTAFIEQRLIPWIPMASSRSRATNGVASSTVRHALGLARYPALLHAVLNSPALCLSTHCNCSRTQHYRRKPLTVGGCLALLLKPIVCLALDFNFRLSGCIYSSTQLRKGVPRGHMPQLQ